MITKQAEMDATPRAMWTRRPLALATLALFLPVAAAAQQPAQCAAGEAAALTSLGIAGLDCDDCILDAATGELRFRSAPTVSGLTRGSRDDGQLREGDQILAVGGQSVTGAAGARRLQASAFDEPVELRIRRDGRVRTITIRPAPCAMAAAPVPAPRAPVVVGAARARQRAAARADAVRPAPTPPAATGRASRTPRPDVAVRSAPTPPVPPVEARARVSPPDVAVRSVPTPPAPPVDARARVSPPDVAVRSVPTPPAPPAEARVRVSPPDAAVRSAPPPPPASILAGQRVDVQAAQPPEGWLGIGLKCTDCSLQTMSDGRIRWSFSDEPVVMSVEPNSPAQRAGLRPGDVLTHINGTTLTSSAGEREFSEIQPGETVRLTYERNRRRATTTLVAAPRPSSPMRAAEAERRYLDLVQSEQQRQRAVERADSQRAQRISQRTDSARAVRTYQEALIQSNAMADQARQAAEAAAAEAEARERAQENRLDPEAYEQLVRQLAELQAAAERTNSRVGAQQEAVTAIAEQFRELQASLERQQRELEARIQERATEERAAASSRNDPVRYAGRVAGANIEVRGTSNVITRIVRQGQEILIVTPDGEIRIHATGSGGR